MAKVDIQKYKRRSYRKKKDLSKFLKKLAKSKPKGILKRVAAADKAVWEEVSCLSCANCCKTTGPRFTSNDIDRLAKNFRKPNAFKVFYAIMSRKRGGI